MSTTSSRTDLAAGLKAGLSGRVNVYPYPADLIKAPAVVVVPSDPYVQPSTYGRSRVTFDITCAVGRTKMGDQLGNLETLADSVVAALPKRYAWVETSKPETSEIGGVELLTLQILVTTAMEATQL